jgi:serine palmitoyltransferase
MCISTCSSIFVSWPSSFQVIIGEDGTDTGRKKLQALRDNSNYFRMRLRDMGFQVLGQFDSPVMPLMLYHPGKIPAFSRECFKRGLAVVVVGFPAVPILMSRARICMSAAHTRAELDYALEQINIVGDLLHIKYNNYRTAKANIQKYPDRTTTQRNKNKSTIEQSKKQKAL